MGIARLTLAAIGIALAAAPARAEPGYHGGLDLRAELGTHPIRAGGGIDFGAIDTLLVLDPMFWTDGQHDLDLLAFYEGDGGWGPLAGWRTTIIGIDGGSQKQQKLVLGLGAPLPRIGDLPIRARWAFELTALVVKHGGDLPSQWISFASGRDFIDLLNFGMFVTVEYATGM